LCEATAQHSKDGKQEFVPVLDRIFSHEGELWCDVSEYRDFKGKRMPLENEKQDSSLLLN